MKPQDLFIGVRDVLALLVPGAVLLILLPGNAVVWLSEKIKFGAKLPDTTLLILVFLIAAMATGSLLSGLAGLADDYVDKYLRNRPKRPSRKGFRGALSRQIENLERTKALAARLESCINPVTDCSEEERPWTTRSFWWNYLRLKCPEAIAELDRLEGLQKQFRSLVVVAFVLAFAALVVPVWGAWERVGGFLPGLRAAIGALVDPSPWLYAFPAFLVGAFCFVSYVGYRVLFSRRLYELAIIHALPEATVKKGSENFFKGESPRRGVKGSADAVDRIPLT